ncbi:hypothetical protein D3C87_1534850 [compost metagenome]
MVALAGPAVVVDVQEIGLFGHYQIALFSQFLDQSLKRRFAMFHPATRQIPARNIGMTHQKDLALRVEAGCANTHRHPAGNKEKTMQQPDHDTRPPCPDLSYAGSAHLLSAPLA